MGTRVGWNNDPDDAYNREVFEEQVAIIKAAWHNEKFSFEGKHFHLPPRKIDDRGRGVGELTLVPKPFNTPVEIWQPVTSPQTAEFVARERHKAVSGSVPHNLKRGWHGYADRRRALPLSRLHRAISPGGAQVTSPLPRSALYGARRCHDESSDYWQVRRSRSYLDDQGKPWEWGRMPTLEDSIAQQAWYVGTADEVTEQVLELQRELGLSYVTIFPHFPGMVREQAIEQMQRFAQDVQRAGDRARCRRANRARAVAPPFPARVPALLPVPEIAALPQEPRRGAVSPSVEQHGTQCRS